MLKWVRKELQKLVDELQKLLEEFVDRPKNTQPSPQWSQRLLELVESSRTLGSKREPVEIKIRLDVLIGSKGVSKFLYDNRKNAGQVGSISSNFFLLVLYTVPFHKREKQALIQLRHQFFQC